MQHLWPALSCTSAFSKPKPRPAPNSLTTTAQRLPCGACRTCDTRALFPAPRKPVIKVTGTGAGMRALSNTQQARPPQNERRAEKKHVRRRVRRRSFSHGNPVIQTARHIVRSAKNATRERVGRTRRSGRSSAFSVAHGSEPNAALAGIRRRARRGHCKHVARVWRSTLLLAGAVQHLSGREGRCERGRGCCERRRGQPGRGRGRLVRLPGLTPAARLLPPRLRHAQRGRGRRGGATRGACHAAGRGWGERAHPCSERIFLCAGLTQGVSHHSRDCQRRRAGGAAVSHSGGLAGSAAGAW